jgi:hypothetical protein
VRSKWSPFSISCFSPDPTSRTASHSKFFSSLSEGRSLVWFT